LYTRRKQGAPASSGGGVSGVTENRKTRHRKRFGPKSKKKEKRTGERVAEEGVAISRTIVRREKSIGGRRGGAYGDAVN